MLGDEDTARQARISAFLEDHGFGKATRETIAGDASFRRYDRLTQPGGTTAILMDAPPPEENVRPFIRIAEHLTAQGLSAPQIYAKDIENGLLLLEDLGDTSFKRALQEAPDQEETLYEAAVDVLASLHHSPLPEAPEFTMEMMLEQTNRFIEWYMPHVVGRSLSDAEQAEYSQLWQAALEQLNPHRKTLILFDYHADNLMWLPEREGVARVGLLDFQDAVIGSPAYDLVSLVEDVRRDVLPTLYASLIQHFIAQFPEANQDNFHSDLALMGAQRSARILGVFVRLCVRDGKANYLKWLPGQWAYLEQSLQHPVLRDVKGWFDAHVPAELRKAVPELSKKAA